MCTQAPICKCAITCTIAHVRDCSISYAFRNSCKKKDKRNFRKFKRTTNPLHLEHYKTLRNKVVSEIRKSKKDYFDKLDNILSLETTDSKPFLENFNTNAKYRKIKK